MCCVHSASYGAWYTACSTAVHHPNVHAAARQQYMQPRWGGPASSYGFPYHTAAGSAFGSALQSLSVLFASVLGCLYLSVAVYCWNVGPLSAAPGAAGPVAVADSVAAVRCLRCVAVDMAGVFAFCLTSFLGLRQSLCCSLLLSSAVALAMWQVGLFSA
jgi:hypothetical protein